MISTLLLKKALKNTYSLTFTIHLLKPCTRELNNQYAFFNKFLVRKCEIKCTVMVTDKLANKSNQKRMRELKL